MGATPPPPPILGLLFAPFYQHEMNFQPSEIESTTLCKYLHKLVLYWQEEGLNIFYHTC